MGFDPNQPFETVKEASPQKFDPSQPFDQVDTPKPEEKVGTLTKISGTVSKAFPRTMLGAALNPSNQDLALRGLDYAGGLARTGIAAATGNANMDDLYSALTGKAPRSSEYLKRAGVPEGPKVPLTNFSARDAGGVVADIATDPLTYYAPLNRVLGAGSAAREAGESLYRSGLKNIDMEGAKYGKEPVSDLLMQNRVTGSARSISNQMQEMADKRLADRNAILQQATDKGAAVDLHQAMNIPQNYLDELKAKANPEMDDAIEKLQSRVEDYTNRAYDTDQIATPLQTSSWKTSAANRVKDADYQRMAYTPEATTFNKKLASGLRQATENSVGETLGQDAADTLRSKNDELGRLLTSQDRAERDAMIAERKNAHTSVDGILAGHAVGSGLSPGAVAAYIGKKLSDVSKESTFRTNGGLFLQDLGQTGIPDALARRTAIDQNSPNNPWVQLSRRQP